MTNKTSSENANLMLLGEDPSEPILIFMRHAARDLRDDTLSPEGHRQTSKLVRILRDMRLPSPTRIQTSPKMRTQMTVRLLEAATHRKNVVDPRLDERHRDESQEAFQARLEAYCETCLRWAQDSDRASDDRVWLVCSHLDWLEAAAWFIPSDENDFERSEPWPPMAIRAYVFRSGIWQRLTRDKQEQT